MDHELRELLRQARSRKAKREMQLDERIQRQQRRWEQSAEYAELSKQEGLLPLNMTRAQVVGLFGLTTSVPVDSRIVIEEQVFFGDIIVSVESKQAPALNNRYRLPLEGGRVALVEKPGIDRSEESAEE